MGHFLPFYPHNSPKNENIKTNLDRSSFYTSVTKTMIIGYTVPEIWHVPYVIVVFHFGLFFALLHLNSPKNQNFKKIRKMPGDIIILHNCTKNDDHMLFYPLPPSNSPISKKWKNHLEISSGIPKIIIDRDMVCDRRNCDFSFWAHFCPFTPLTAQKTKISKN